MKYEEKKKVPADVVCQLEEDRKDKMNNIDRELCEEMADLWQSKDGDADGFCYGWMIIHDILKAREAAINEILKNRVTEKI